MSRADGLELLEGMLRIPSESGDEDRIGEWLVQRLTALGFESRRDAAGNVHGVWGEGPTDVVLLGHMDTVPGHIDVRYEDGRLFGRGSVDAKGPLAAAICAVGRQPVAGSHRFTVIGAVEEERSSRGARHLTARPGPDHLVVLEPSGWDGVTLGYKGSLRVGYRLAQPKGHGAGREPSAGDRAVEFIRRAQEHAAAINEGASLFERLDVRVLHLEMAGDGLEEVATAALGFRLPPGSDADVLMGRLELWRGEAVLECHGVEPPVRASKSTPLARAFVQAIRAQGGLPRYKLKTGTSDMNILAPAWGCPSLAYGPGESALDHTPGESVDIDEWTRGVDVLTTALSSL
ncbi:MAG: [LysW]-lysine hydrolase [Candidatus Dormibacteria bacterium]